MTQTKRSVVLSPSQDVSSVTSPRRRSLLAAGLGAVAVSGFPAIVRAQANKIPVAVVVGLTGRASAWGVPVADAVKLCVDQINSSGGIKSKQGAQIELILADHQSNPQMAGTQTERVIQVNNALVVLGNATSGATVVGSAAAEKNKTAMLSTDAADTLTAKGLKYYFRIGPKASAMATTAVNFAMETAKANGVAPKKVATIADDSTFSQDAINGVLRALKGTSWALQENVSFPAGSVSDFTPILQRLKLAGVDTIFQATFAPDGIQILRAMKTLNFDLTAWVHVLGAPYTPEFNAAVKRDGNFITDAVGFVPELSRKNALLNKFSEAYRAKYGKDLDDQSSLGANSVAVLYDALERATSLDREAIAQAIRSTDLQPGANPFLIRDGVKFDSAGDNTRASGIVMQLRDEQQRIVYPASFATEKVVWPMPKWSAR